MESGSGSAASELITVIGKYAEALKTILSGPRGDEVTINKQTRPFISRFLEMNNLLWENPMIVCISN